MRAAVLHQIGDINDLSKHLTIEEYTQPVIENNEVLIKIKNSSLNHRDLWITKGQYSKIILPVVLGSDGAGVINSKGSSVSEFEIGDKVIINPAMNWGDKENYQSRKFKILGMPDDGTFAEFVKANKQYVHKIPPHLTLYQAATFPLAGITAFRALFKKGNIASNDNILITGIGGGVSIFALIFALKIGATVFISSVNDFKIEKAISLGAKAGVNYRDESWDKKIIEASNGKINTVIDGSGAKTFSKCVNICNYGGEIVSYGATLGSVLNFDLHKLYWKQLRIFGSTMGSQQDFSDMIEFVNKNKILPVIDEMFSLNNISEAFMRMNDSKQFGKIVIEI